MSSGRDSVSCDGDPVSTGPDEMFRWRYLLPCPRNQMSSTRDSLSGHRDPVSTRVDSLPTYNDALSGRGYYLPCD